jgi:hypothetical protein
VKALVIEHCRVGVCVNSALRLMMNRGVKPIAAVDDGVIVTAGEAVVYVNDDQLNTLNQAMQLINLSICASTAMATVRLNTGLRPFIYSSELRELGEYANIPVITSGGGVVDDANLFSNGGPIPVVKNYTTNPAEDGVLVIRLSGDLSSLVETVNKTYATGYSGDVIIESDVDSVLRFRKTLRRIAPAILGIVVTGVRRLCTLSVVDVDAVRGIFRCRRCWIDYVGVGQLKTCPRCGGRLVELVKMAERIRPMSDDALLARSLGELTSSKPMRPIILPLSWFTQGKRGYGYKPLS